MTTARRLVIVLLLGVFAAPQPGNAGCAGPTVDAMPNTRRAGQLVLVTGETWVGYCDDNGDDCGGCDSCEPGEDERVDRVTLEIRRRGTLIAELETVDVSSADSFAAEVRLPRDLEPGRYRIVGRGTPAADHAWSPLTIVD